MKKRCSLLVLLLLLFSAPSATASNSIIEEATNLISWQMDHGGWSKDMPQIYTRQWDGTESKSVWKSNGHELGTIDNDATTSEIRLVANAYQLTADPRFKNSVLRGVDFLNQLQYPSGGFRQVYPQRGQNPSSSVWYSNYVTFNDHATIRVLSLLEDIILENEPFQGDLFTQEQRNQAREALMSGVEYILHAQIISAGDLAGWGQQHDPVSYEPLHGRAYEHPSIAVDETVGIVEWLMNQTVLQSDEIDQAVQSSLAWLDQARLTNTRYERRIEPHFFPQAGVDSWYRFYEVNTERPIFSGRDGIVRYSIMEIEQERRFGYAWAGTWPYKLLN